MKAEKAYVIMFQYDKYDYADPELFSVSHDVEKAREELTRIKGHHQELSEHRDLLFEFVRDIGEQMPYEDYLEYPEMEKWPAGLGIKDITDEMMAERIEKKRECALIDEKNKKSREDYDEIIDQLKTEFISTFDKRSRDLFDEVENMSYPAINPNGFYMVEVGVIP